MTRLAQFKKTLDARFLDASVTDPADNWFMLVDAAQYPHNDAMDWGREAQYGRWGNLLLANPEGQEPDLTAWLVPLAGDSHGLDLPGWVDLDLPKKKLGMLRLYDGCALQHMFGILDEDQCDTLSAPARHWLYCDRAGDLQMKSREPAGALASFPLELTEEQVTLLKRATHVDRIILDLKVAEWLPHDADAFDAYELVSERVKIAQRYNIPELSRQFEFVATTLRWSPEWLASNELTSRLREVSSTGNSIVDALAELPQLMQAETHRSTKGI